MLKSSSGIRRAAVIPCPTPVDTHKFIEAAEMLRFRDCAKSQEESWGFIPPDYTDLWPRVPQSGRVLIITLRQDRRIPDKRKLSREWLKAIHEQEKNEGRKLDKGERATLRDTVKAKFLAATPPREREYQALYDAERQAFVVLESSKTNIEFVVDKLNHALKNQGMTLVWEGREPNEGLERTLTAWAYRPQDIPENLNLTLGVDYRLVSDDAKAVLSNHSSGSQEINVHLVNEKRVELIELYWGEKVSFMLSARGIVSRADFESYCSDGVKGIRENDAIEDVRVYQEGLFLVYYSAFWELWDVVGAIPTDI